MSPGFFFRTRRLNWLRQLLSTDQLLQGHGQILQEIMKMAVDTSKLVAIVTQLKADNEKNTADIQAIIDKLSNTATTDPATQAVIDQAVADLTTIATNTEASNAKAEKAATGFEPSNN